MSLVCGYLTKSPMDSRLHKLRCGERLPLLGCSCTMSLSKALLFPILTGTCRYRRLSAERPVASPQDFMGFTRFHLRLRLRLHSPLASICGVLFLLQFVCVLQTGGDLVESFTFSSPPPPPSGRLPVSTPI